MRIKFLTSIAGANFSHKPGDEVTWKDEAEAERFVNAGYATKVEAAPAAKPERAEKPKPAAKPERAEGASGSERATRDR